MIALFVSATLSPYPQHIIPFDECVNSQNAFPCRTDVSRAFGASTCGLDNDHLPLRGSFASCFLTSYRPISILGPYYDSSLYGKHFWVSRACPTRFTPPCGSIWRTQDPLELIVTMSMALYRAQSCPRSLYPNY